MHKIKLIFKGTLLWFIAILTIIIIFNIDNIMDVGFIWVINAVLLDTILITNCYSIISEEEFKQLSTYNLFTGILDTNMQEEE